MRAGGGKGGSAVRRMVGGVEGGGLGSGSEREKDDSVGINIKEAPGAMPVLRQSQRINAAQGGGGKEGKDVAFESQPNARAGSSRPLALEALGGHDNKDGSRAQLSSLQGMCSRREVPAPARIVTGPRIPTLVCVLPQGTQLANGLRHILSCAIIARDLGMNLAVDPAASLSAMFFVRNMGGVLPMVRLCALPRPSALVALLHRFRFSCGLVVASEHRKLLLAGADGD